MHQFTDNEALAKRYLLGLLSPEEVARFEQRYFADDSLFEEMETVEDQLVDAYVRGELNANDRNQFESALSNSKRLAERVQLGRVLAKRISITDLPRPIPVPEPSRWRAFLASLFTDFRSFATAAMVLLLLLGGVLMTIAWFRSREELRRLNTQRAQLEQQQQDLAQRVEQLQANANRLNGEVQSANAERDRLNQELRKTEEELANVRRQSGTSAVVAVTLFPGPSRGAGGEPDLTVPKKPATVRLNLALDNDQYPRYSVSIESPDRRVVVAQRDLSAKGPASQRTIALQFPSTKLSAGEYAVTVSGLTPSGTYVPVFSYGLRVSRREP